jgi:hypothetical protein
MADPGGSGRGVLTVLAFAATAGGWFAMAASDAAPGPSADATPPEKEEEPARPTPAVRTVADRRPSPPARVAPARAPSVAPRREEPSVWDLDPAPSTRTARARRPSPMARTRSSR